MKIDIVNLNFGDDFLDNMLPEEITIDSSEVKYGKKLENAVKKGDDDAIGKILNSILDGIFVHGVKSFDFEYSYKDIPTNKKLKEDVDLSNAEGSVTKIIKDNTDIINSATTKPELIAIVTELFKDSTSNGSKLLIDRVKRSKSYFDALQVIYNTMLKGMGQGSIEREITKKNEDVHIDKRTGKKYWVPANQVTVPVHLTDSDDPEDAYSDWYAPDEDDEFLESTVFEHILYDLMDNPDLGREINFKRRKLSDKLPGTRYKISTIFDMEPGKIKIAIPGKVRETKALSVADKYDLDVHTEPADKNIKALNDEKGYDYFKYYIVLDVPESIANLDAEEYLASL